MSKDIVIGIDNGTTGSISILEMDGKVLLHTKLPVKIKNKWTPPQPVKHRKKAGEKKTGLRKKREYFQPSYTVIDSKVLQDILVRYTSTVNKVYCIIENPAVSYHSGFNMDTSLSAVMAWDRVTEVLDRIGVAYTFTSSKRWQRFMVPEAMAENNKDTKIKSSIRNTQLKKASTELAHKLFPNTQIVCDGDSLLMAEWYRKFIKGEIVVEEK